MLFQRERERETQRETERDTERDRERDREKHTERDTERDTQRETQRHRQREKLIETPNRNSENCSLKSLKIISISSKYFKCCKQVWQKHFLT